MVSLRLTVFLLLFVASPVFGQFKLVKDFYYDGGNPTASSMPLAPFDPWVLHNDNAYFIATDNILGTCVFKTDGTFDGTSVAIDPDPGADGPDMKGLIVAGNNLFYLAVDPAVSNNPLRLYVGDESSSIVSLSNVEVMGPSTDNMISFNDHLFFTGSDGAHGFELWKSDGTPTGTVMVKDLTNGATGTDEALTFYPAANNLYFSKKIGTTLYELWKTDGSEEGTVLIRSFQSLGITNLKGKDQSVFMNNTLYFVAAINGSPRDLWKTDGTTEGTAVVSSNLYDITSIHLWNDKIFFANIIKSFISDGTTLNTKTLLETSADFTAVSVFNNKLYFFNNSSLWRTDGTVAGTKFVTSPQSGYRYMGISSNRNGVLLLSIYKFNQTIKLRMDIYDEANAKVIKVHDNDDGENLNTPYPAAPLTIKTFHDDFLLAYAADSKGTEPWITDGTPGNIQLLRDINSWSNAYSSPQGLVAIGDKVFFGGDYGVSAIWSSDGTRTGTQIITPDRSILNRESSFFYGVTDVNGKAVFRETYMRTSTIPYETTYYFWGSDGTPAGSRPVVNIDDGDSYIYGPIRGAGPAWNGNYYFFLPNSMMRTDGTSTSLIKSDLDYGYPYIQGTGTLEDYFVFIGNSGMLWRSDGTDAGTTQVTQLEFLPYQFKTAGKYSYFIGSSNYVYSLWRTDATAEGTINLQPSGVSSGVLDIQFQTTLDSVLIFTSKTDQNGRELWRSDGTTEGTFMIKDIAAGSGDLDFVPVYNDDSLFYFTVNGGGKTTMWKTNGTMDGTSALFDLPQILKPLQGYLHNDRVFFPATDESGRTQIWMTDFTANGTRMLDELGPASDEVNVKEMVGTSATLFVLTKDKLTRTKLWTIDPAFVFKKDQDIVFDLIGDKKVGDAPFELTAKTSSDLPIEFSIVSGPGSIDGTTLTITGPGTISVQAMQSGNEEFFPATTSQSFKVTKEGGEVTGIEESIRVTVWPNPATNTIIVNAQTMSTIVIKDVLGRDVISANVSGESTTIDVSQLPRGMYFVKLKSVNESVITRKVILK